MMIINCKYMFIYTCYCCDIVEQSQLHLTKVKVIYKRELHHGDSQGVTMTTKTPKVDWENIKYEIKEGNGNIFFIKKIKPVF